VSRHTKPRVVELADRLERDIRARQLAPGDAYLNAADAARMLRALSGRSHQVLTAVAVSHGRRTLTACSRSRVRFAPLPEPVIERYVAGGEPFGKAGAYAVQGAIAGWIEQVHGSHSAIMGLPLFETTQLLQRARVRLVI
jgi:septum formation protein